MIQTLNNINSNLLIVAQFNQVLLYFVIIKINWSAAQMKIPRLSILNEKFIYAYMILELLS